MSGAKQCRGWGRGPPEVSRALTVARPSASCSWDMASVTPNALCVVCVAQIQSSKALCADALRVSMLQLGCTWAEHFQAEGAWLQLCLQSLAQGEGAAPEPASLGASFPLVPWGFLGRAVSAQRP